MELPKKEEVKIPKEVKKKNRTFKKFAGITLTVFLALIATGVGVDAFFDRYDLHFQSPIVVRTPVWLTSRDLIISPVSDDQPSPATQSATLKLIPEVEASEDRILKGEASYYSEKDCLGCDENLIMANGERLDDAGYTVALPPSYVSKYKLLNDSVKIVNPKNNNTVIAKVTDTGGFYELTGGKRVADLSVAVKEALGCNGLCDVEIHY